jgi:Ca2+-binding RTX toxin-like protein
VLPCSTKWEMGKPMSDKSRPEAGRGGGASPPSPSGTSGKGSASGHDACNETQDKGDAAKAAADKAAAAKAEAAKAEAAKAEAAKAQAAKAEHDKAEAAKAEAAKADAAKAQAAQAEHDKTEAAKAEAAKAEHDKAEATKSSGNKGRDDDTQKRESHDGHDTDDKDGHGDRSEVGNNSGNNAGGGAKVTVPESLVLTTADAKAAAVVGQVISGGTTADALTAKGGSDSVFGLKGNDTIHGADAGPQTVKLAIDANLSGAANPDAVSILISGVPAGAQLSAGHLNANGTWTLSKADLADLSLTGANASDFTLKVSASATDGSGLVQTSTLNVSLGDHAGNLLVGGKGSDTIFGSANGDDVIYGGNVPTGQHHAGPAHIPTIADNDVIHVGNGNVHAFGQAGDDTIYGGKGTGELNGGSGNDTIVAGGGNYLVKGGAGFDTLDFSAAASAVTVDLHKHTASGFGDLTIKGIEAIIGSAQDDVMWGGRGGATFTGGAGNDVFGAHKSDVKNGGVVHVTDFGAGDRLDVSELVGGRDPNAVLKVTDGANGTTVSVKIGKVYYDAFELDGVHGLTLADMMAKAAAGHDQHAQSHGNGHEMFLV